MDDIVRSDVLIEKLTEIVGKAAIQTVEVTRVLSDPEEETQTGMQIVGGTQRKTEMTRLPSDDLS